jgi:cob(I)alamin adenosyltransferase
MKIYTKTGDDGTTALFGGQRVVKDSIRIETYGTVDEVNSILGVARAVNSDNDIEDILDHLQNDLFVLGADLATPIGKEGVTIPRIDQKHITFLETTIDAVELELSPLKNFILPGGSVVAAYLHFARTVCRRAERHAVHLSRIEQIGEFVVVYLNRLSDLLFVLARLANKRDGIVERPWKAG